MGSKQSAPVIILGHERKTQGLEVRKFDILGLQPFMVEDVPSGKMVSGR